MLCGLTFLSRRRKRIPFFKYYSSITFPSNYWNPSSKIRGRYKGVSNVCLAEFLTRRDSLERKNK
jgi:hypothetical protein